MSAPVIKLPHQFEGLTLSKVADDVVNCSPNGLPPEIEVDFSKLRFIRPAGVVFLSNLIWWFHYRQTKVQLTGVGGESAALGFLDDSLFFEQHCGKKLKSLTQKALAVYHRL